MQQENKSNNISIKFIDHNSDAYRETVKLRYDILRKPLGLTFTEDQLALESGDFHFALYINDKELAACLIMSPQSDGSIKMRQVAVKENLQGSGLGRQLVEFVETWSAENNFNPIILHARESAVPFYLAQKYAIVGEPFTEVNIPHRKMIKSLKII